MHMMCIYIHILMYIYIYIQIALLPYCMACSPLLTASCLLRRSWLTELQWAQLKSLEQISTFKSATSCLTQNMEQDTNINRFP